MCCSNFGNTNSLSRDGAASISKRIVVRSHGPDTKAGTIDDQLAIRMANAPVKKFVGQKVQQGIQAARDKLGEMLPKRNNEKPGDE